MFINNRTFLPDLFFSLLNQIHQNLIEVVLVAVVPGVLLLRSLHVLLVRGTGDVAGVIGQAHHRHLAYSALVSAVPGEGRRERAFNRSFRHRSDLAWFLVLLPAEPATTFSGSTFCYFKVKK